MVGVVAAAALVALAGCANHATRTSARVLPPGTWRTAAALDALVFERGVSTAVLPAVEVRARRGVSPAWDVGFAAGLTSAHASARVRLFDRPEFAVAVVPGVGIDFAVITNNGTDVLRGIGFAHLVGEIDLSRRASLLVALRSAVVLGTPPALLAGATDDARGLLEPGISAGVRVALSRRLVLWPEITTAFPYALSGGFEQPIVQAGVALEF